MQEHQKSINKTPESGARRSASPWQLSLPEVARLFKASAEAWLDDDAASLGAAISFYTFFSMAPMLLIAISIAGFWLGPEVAQGHVMSELRATFGSEAAESIRALLISASKPAESAWGTVIGLATVFIGATTVFSALQSAMDRIWQAPKLPGSGVWAFVQSRLLSFGVVLGIGFLLLVSLLLDAALAALGLWWGDAFGGWRTLARVANFVIGLGLTTLLFGLVYRLLPRVPVAWADVWFGATVTALLFSLGKTLIALYIGRTGVASTYGAAGSIVVLLLWVYYSAQIFLLGAEFTWVYANQHGSRSTGELHTADSGSQP